MSELLKRIFDAVFGCHHAHYTFPVTARWNSRNVPAAARATGTYVVCTDCGKEFPYDWTRMCIL